jgi:hypothetical protein
MFGRCGDSLQELIRNQHDEFMQYQRRRDEELQRRDEEFWRRDEEFRQRGEELRSLMEETREFNREILLRNEKVYTSVIAQLEENTEQTRANTKAVLSMLDRLNGSGGVAA